VAADLSLTQRSHSDRLSLYSFPYSQTLSIYGDGCHLVRCAV